MTRRLPAADATNGASGNEVGAPVPSWIVGVCGLAAVASALFSILLFLNR
jgi:hypothetical protein